MEKISLTQHEGELRDELARTPEHEVADWATQNLAVVIARAGNWTSGSPHKYRHRAMLFLSIRLLRAVRASMTVHAAGWEVEARALDRLTAEIRARLLQVTEDPTDETGRLWLERKLAEKSSISSALKASLVGMDPAMVRDLYRALSQDSHADVGGVLRSLTEMDEDGVTAEITWGPRHTDVTRHSLAFLAALAIEAATWLAVEAGVSYPERDALVARFNALQRPLLEESEGEGYDPRGPPGPRDDG